MSFCKGRPFVLFADDDPDILGFLVAAAHIRGWCVDTAKTAREILAKVNEHCSDSGTCYDAIVADVHYFDSSPESGPRMTGISAAAQIKEKYPDLPIIFISAFGSTLMKDEARKVGEDFFDKPLDTDRLLNRVQQLIEFTTMALGGPGNRAASTDALKVPDVLEEVMSNVRAVKAASAAAAWRMQDAEQAHRRRSTD